MPPENQQVDGQQPPNGNNGNGNGNGQQPPANGNGKGGEQIGLEEITEAVKILAQGMSRIQDGHKDLMARFEQLQAAPPKGGGKENEDIDLETLTNKELLERISNSVVDRITTEVVKPLQEQLTQVGSKTELMDAQSAIREFRAKPGHEDFDEWKDEMRAMLEQNPYLKVNELYVLAKDANPDKAAKMAEKYRDKSKDVKKPAKFGGLTPTSGTNLNLGGDKKVTQKQAALAAWDAVAAQLGEPGSEESNP